MSNILVVTGMHRSGTSLVAGYLRACGLDLGSQMLPPDAGSPLGYHEDQAFLALHRSMLDPRFEDGFRIRPKDLPIPVTEEARSAALGLVRARATKPQWGWKEPRTVLFSNMWRECLPQATFLFLYRRPSVVLDSLLRRGTDECVRHWPVRGLRAWRTYNQVIADFVLRYPDCSILWEIDHLITRPTELVKQLKGRDFELADTPFEAVFSPNRLRRAASLRGRVSERAFSVEMGRCRRLYQRLGELHDAA